MVVGILGAIGLILHGIGTVTTKAWTVTKDFVGWMFSVMPKPMRIFFFLYFISFLSALVIPFFLGTTFQCTTDGEAYKMNFIEIDSKINHIENLASVCANTELNATDTTPQSFFGVVSALIGDVVSSIQRTFLTTTRVWTIYQSIETGNYTDYDPVCQEFRDIEELSQEDQHLITRDLVLKSYGEKVEQENYENLIHVGCSQDKEGTYQVSLLFYTLDIFKLELWLLLGLLGIIVPMAYKYYDQFR